MYTLLLAVSLLLLTAADVSAQVTITKLYSEGTNKTDPTDWVEISNTTGSDYNLNGHRLEDTASSNPIVIEWSNALIINANSACLFFVGNRLNKAGDTLYLKNGDSQIDCVAYGNKNDGVCDKTISPSGADDHTALHCEEIIPEPTSPPQTQTPTPTVKPIPSPVPTVVLTAKPESTPEVLGIVDERETATATPEPAPIQMGIQQIEQNTHLDEDTDTKPNYMATILFATGLVCIGISVAHVIYSEYNKKYFDNQTFN